MEGQDPHVYAVIYLFAGRHNATDPVIIPADTDSPSFCNPKALPAFGASISMFHFSE